MNRADFRIFVQFILDFGITAGSIIGGAMLQSGTATMPTAPVIVLALIMGFTVAARRADATIKGQPAEDLEQTVRQLVAQMRTVQVATAQVLPSSKTEPPAPTSGKLIKDSS